MRRALNLLRPGLHYRRTAFDDGLAAVGFKVWSHRGEPAPGDVLITWNAYGQAAEQGARFRAAGARHIVVENGPLSKGWRGGEWFSMALDAVAVTGGTFPAGRPLRWAARGVELAPWRPPGGETVILGQRSIGAPGVRSPHLWAESVRAKVGGRIRPHPGTGAAVSLEDDLRNASRVITWSSSAALQALLLGVPVWHAHPAFLGAAASRPLSEWPGEARRDDAARLAVFEQMAWAMWTLEEVRTGEPIRRLLAQ